MSLREMHEQQKSEQASRENGSRTEPSGAGQSWRTAC